VFDISQQMWCSWLGDGVVHGPVSQSHSGYLEQSPNSAICFASYPTYAITFFFFLTSNGKPAVSPTLGYLGSMVQDPAGGGQRMIEEKVAAFLVQGRHLPLWAQCSSHLAHPGFPQRVVRPLEDPV
jgi:hypothetical protein